MHVHIASLDDYLLPDLQTMDDEIQDLTDHILHQSHGLDFDTDDFSSDSPELAALRMESASHRFIRSR